MLHALQDIDLNESLTTLATIPLLTQALKGGGRGAAEVETGAPPNTSGGTFFPNMSMSGTPGSPPPFIPGGTMPLYSTGGKNFEPFRIANHVASITLVLYLKCLTLARLSRRMLLLCSEVRGCQLFPDFDTFILFVGAHAVFTILYVLKQT